MPRDKKPLSARDEKRLQALMAAGGTAQTISKALRAKGAKGPSAATVGRRMRELRGDVAPRRVARSSASDRADYAMSDASIVGDTPLPASPEEIPEGTALAQIERWLARAEAMGKVAVSKGDLAAMGQMGRLTSALLEAKRKATPLEKEDPTEGPDMVKLAQQVEVRLLKYVDDILGEK